MAGISVKMSADVSAFSKGMQEARENVKTLDAELKLNEKQLKAVGDAELYASNKADILNRQMEEQKKVVAGIQGQLQEMKDRGVDKTSAAYQKLERSLLNATGKMMDIQTELNTLSNNEKDAATEASNLDTNVRKIGKGVGFQNLASGLKEITDKLESGARAAVNFGKKVARSAMDSTEWADDILTRATKWGVDAETVQRMDNVADIIDTDVDTIITAQNRLSKSSNRDKLSELLGIDTTNMTANDALWAAGEALMAMSETMDDMEMNDVAQQIFGKGWQDLVPLFKAGQEVYEQLMAEQEVLSNDQVRNLGEMNDQFDQIKQKYELMKNEFWAENSDTVIGLMQWILDNKDALIGALGAIGAAFAALKIGEFAVNVGKVVNGLNDILKLGGKKDPVSTAEDVSKTTSTGTGGKTGLSAIGSWILDGLGISGWGVFGGAGISAAIVYAVGEYVASLNDAAIKAREVSTDIHRLDNVFSDQVNDIPQELSNAMNGVMKDKRLVLQETVRALLGTTGGSSSVYGELKYLGYNLNNDVFDAFNYTNTSGESRNKLLDMLNMSGDMTPATAALVLRSAGIDVNDTRLGGYSQMYQNALMYLDNNWMDMKRNGGFTEGLGIIEDYFRHSGVYDENGQWSIPSLLEEEAAKNAEAADAIVAAAETLQTLPETTASAVRSSVQGVKISFNLGDLLTSHANGIWNVPWDGYPALLHKGERVLTAREANTYNANSHLYIENMHMGSDLEAEALAEKLARHTQRLQKGYGS